MDIRVKFNERMLVLSMPNTHVIVKGLLTEPMFKSVSKAVQPGTYLFTGAEVDENGHMTGFCDAIMGRDEITITESLMGRDKITISESSFQDGVAIIVLTQDQQRELAETIYEDFEFPATVLEANGWVVSSGSDRFEQLLLSRTVFLVDPHQPGDSSVKAVFTVDFRAWKSVMAHVSSSDETLDKYVLYDLLGKERLMLNALGAIESPGEPEKDGPNKNVLLGMRCPHCGSYGPFRIAIKAVALVRDDGFDKDDIEQDDIEWDDKSWCDCPKCGWGGDVLLCKRTKTG